MIQNTYRHAWEIECGDAEQQSFVQMKAALASPEVLAFSDWNRQFTLRTDASEVGAGAVLDQVIGEETFRCATAGGDLQSVSV